MGRAVIINLTDAELKKLGDLVDSDTQDDDDVEFAIKMLIEFLSKER